MGISITRANLNDLPQLLPLVGLYHIFEEISMTDQQREGAITPLLANDDFGSIWLIFSEEHLIGYIAFCYIYSIEFQGIDSFIDEFYILENHRGSGAGSVAFSRIKEELFKRKIRTITLEVAHSNLKAQRFYSRLGFVSRERYTLMSCPLLVNYDR